VYIALPHRLLAPVAERALGAGHAAIVEKPMALDLATIARLDALARARRLTLGVMFELRESGPTRIARELVTGGAIGTVTAVRLRTLIDKPMTYWRSGFSSRVPSTWRARRSEAGGGVVLMNAIHQLDMLRSVTGLEMGEATGLTGTLVADVIEVEVEDTAAGVFRLSNGAIGSLVAGAHVAGAAAAETIEIDGTLGSLRIPDLYVPGDCSVYLRRAWRDLPPGTWTTVASADADPFRATIQGFCGAVRDGRPAPVGAADAAAALAVVLAIYGNRSPAADTDHGRTT
jgi:predicted dehydrogenase